jgi:hypothetical protein
MYNPYEYASPHRSSIEKFLSADQCILARSYHGVTAPTDNSVTQFRHLKRCKSVMIRPGPYHWRINALTGHREDAINLHRR